MDIISVLSIPHVCRNIFARRPRAAIALAAGEGTESILNLFPLKVPDASSRLHSHLFKLFYSHYFASTLNVVGKYASYILPWAPESTICLRSSPT
jgi:hypothetical protein